MKMKKSSNISADALHRFIPQPASGRSSALPCLAAILVLAKFLWEMLLHSLFFRPQTSIQKHRCTNQNHGVSVCFAIKTQFHSYIARNFRILQCLMPFLLISSSSIDTTYLGKLSGICSRTPNSRSMVS